MQLFLYNFLTLVVIGLSAGIGSLWLFILFFLIICSIQWLCIKQNVEHIIVKISFGGMLFLSIFYLFGTGFGYSFIFTLSFFILFWSGIKNNKQKALLGGLIVLICLSVSGLPITFLMLGLSLTLGVLLILIESQTVKSARSRINICIVTTSIGMFVYMLLPALLALCKYLLFVLFTGSAFVTGPILNNGVDLLLGLQTKEETKEEPSEDMVGIFLNEEAGKSDPVLGGYLLFGGIVVASIILLSYRLHKRNKQGITVNAQPKLITKLIPVPEEKITLKPPHHLIRKNVYGWEKKLVAPLARRKAEGFSQWVSRLTSESASSKERVVSVYQDVRYGNGQVSKEEIKEFKREFEEMVANLTKDRTEK